MEITTRPFSPDDEKSVIQLWKDCGLVVPWNDPGKDIRRKMKVQPEMFLVVTSGKQVIGSVMAGYEGHRGWINYLAVHPDHRRAGIAHSLMNTAEELLREKGCPKINLQVRTSNTEVIQFYRKIGFKIDDAVSMGKRLEPDD